MDKSRWERFGAFSGVAFVFLVIATFAVVPTAPKLSDLSAQVTYLAENRSGLLAQSYIMLLALMCLLWFAGSVRSHLRRNEGEPGRLASVSFAGAVTTALFFGIGMLLFTGGALRADAPQDPAIVRALVDLGVLSVFVFAFASAAVWVGATAVAAYRTDAFPKPYAIISGILAIALAATPAVIFGSTGFFSIEETFGAPAVALWATMVWIVGTSVMLIVGEAAVIERAVEEPHEGWHLRRAAGE